MELVLKTSGQQCLVGSNPTASALSLLRAASGGLPPSGILIFPFKEDPLDQS